MSTTELPALDWQVLLPVKQLTRAKTRMHLSFGARTSLVVAMLRDVIAAVRTPAAVRGVHIITRDTNVDRLARAEGIPAWTVSGAIGLNDELREAAARIHQTKPDDGVAVFLPDLPCLDAVTVAAVLGYAERACPSYIPDFTGAGTTVLLAPPGVPMQPQFGTQSAAAHALDGKLVRTSDGHERAQRDVDTVDDLIAAVGQGVGQHTAAEACALGVADLLPPRHAEPRVGGLAPQLRRSAGGFVLPGRVPDPWPIVGRT